VLPLKEVPVRVYLLVVMAADQPQVALVDRLAVVNLFLFVFRPAYSTLFLACVIVQLALVNV